MALTEAVLDLLVAKGMVTAGEVRRALELVDAASPAAGARAHRPGLGRSRLQGAPARDANAAAGELGIDAGAIPIRAVENTPTSTT